VPGDELSLDEARANLAEVRRQLAEVDAGIAELRKTRTALVRARASLQEFISARTEQRSGLGDEYVVETSALAPIVERWLSSYNAEHGRGGIDALARLFGGDPGRLYKIRKGQTRYTTLAVAEELLHALGRGYMLSTGEVEIRPNPYRNGGSNFHRPAVPDEHRTCDD
jgi:hypothetical protein